MSADIKRFSVVEFSGKGSDWDPWSEKFLARAKRKGWKDYLLGVKSVPTKTEVDAASADNDKIGGYASRHGCHS